NTQGGVEVGIQLHLHHDVRVRRVLEASFLDVNSVFAGDYVYERVRPLVAGFLSMFLRRTGIGQGDIGIADRSPRRVGHRSRNGAIGALSESQGRTENG